MSPEQGLMSVRPDQTMLGCLLNTPYPLLYRSIGKGGTVRDGTLICPCHGSAFDLQNGHPDTLPATVPVPVYAASVVNGEVVVDVTKKDGAK